MGPETTSVLGLKLCTELALPHLHLLCYIYVLVPLLLYMCLGTSYVIYVSTCYICVPCLSALRSPYCHMCLCTLMSYMSSSCSELCLMCSRSPRLYVSVCRCTEFACNCRRWLLLRARLLRYFSVCGLELLVYEALSY